MSKHHTKLVGRSQTRVLGAKAFAAISAVEGLQLSSTSKKRLALLKDSEMTPAERRAEVLRAYASVKGRK